MTCLSISCIMINMNSRDSFGKVGEDLACGHLSRAGYSIIERNYRKKFGEVDIIAKDRDGTLVFVEVKALRGVMDSETALIPEDNLSAGKLKRIQKTAQVFVAKHPEHIDERRGWRIDLVAINAAGDAFNIRHYQNIDIL